MDQRINITKAKNSNIVLTFDEETHRYYSDGVLVPGVTHILNVLYKYPQGDARPKRLIDAAFFGKVVHRACELDDKGTLDESTVSPNAIPYLDAWRLFKRDMRIRNEDIFLNEAQLLSICLGNKFAGTVDRVIFDMVIDLKTSASHNPLTPIQLAGYEMLYNENYPDNPARKRVEVLLRRDGTYDKVVHRNPVDSNIFLSAFNVYNFKMANGYEI